MLTDSLGRRIKDLRISVTDRCNFFCTYCRSEFAAPPRGREEILRFEEILRLSNIFVRLGIEKVRLTGGEPLLRREIELLVRGLSRVEGLRDLAMTTNGYLLKDRAAALREAGLRRLNISLDSTREDRFNAIAGTGAYARVIEGIRAAQDAGYEKIRINTVLIRGVNEDEMLEILEFGRSRNFEVRFIEFMPIEDGDRWHRDLVVTADEILREIGRRFEVQPLPARDPSQTAREYRLPETGAVFGIIASISNPFCGACSRVRLTADGCLRTCLFSTRESDLKPLLRGGAGDLEIEQFLTERIAAKEPGHTINSGSFVKPGRRMLAIGG